MFIQKVLHIHRSLDETRAQLANLAGLRRRLPGVETAVITEDGTGQFDCALPRGLRVHCVLVELPTADPNQILFQSTTGNVDLSGLLEFTPVRENLTEVQITLEYGFKSPLAAICDRLFRCVEAFFLRQLAATQVQIEGALAVARNGVASQLAP
ncbi:MAG TPA: SRPBCC family protein [Chthoniobacteraceae bacterium]|nr:SRPBCC family protein [Chthoniobacteraceae bacterium]